MSDYWNLRIYTLLQHYWDTVCKYYAINGEVFQNFAVILTFNLSMKDKKAPTHAGALSLMLS